MIKMLKHVSLLGTGVGFSVSASDGYEVSTGVGFKVGASDGYNVGN